MTASRRRLTRLEETARIEESADPVAVWTYRLCEGRAIPTAIKRMTRTRAIRRAMHERRYPPSTMVPLEVMGEWIHIEESALGQLVRETHDLFVGIERWCEEPDTLGWPSARSYADSAMTCTAHHQFWKWVDHWRRHVDRQRAADQAAVWRADNPAWHPGMTDEEFLAFDLVPFINRHEGG